MITGATIRKESRKYLPGNWGMAIIVPLVSGLVASFILSLFGGGFVVGALPLAYYGDILTNLERGSFQTLPDVWQGLGLGVFSTGLVIWSVIYALLSIVVNALVSAFNLHAFQGPVRGRKLSFGEGFAGLREAGWLRAFLTQLWMMLFVSLWSVLFFFPGIVKAYAYSQAPYIVRDDRAVPPRKALKASMSAMKGYKGKLFGVDLTFAIIPLLISLAGIALLSLAGFLVFMSTEQDVAALGGLVFVIILAVILFIAQIVVGVYCNIRMQIAHAWFHDALMREQQHMAGLPYGRDYTGPSVYTR